MSLSLSLPPCGLGHPVPLSEGSLMLVTSTATPKGELEVGAAVGKSYFDEELIRCIDTLEARQKKNPAAATFHPFCRSHLEAADNN